MTNQICPPTNLQPSISFPIIDTSSRSKLLTTLLLVRIPPFTQLLPEVINLFLILTSDLKGHGLVEFEQWPTVQGDKWMSIEVECNDHYAPWRFAMKLLARFGVALDMLDGRILKDGGVEIGGLFGLIVEPKACSKFAEGHGDC